MSEAIREQISRVRKALDDLDRMFFEREPSAPEAVEAVDAVDAGRDINLIVIHCAATKPDQDIGVREIDEWHRARGWSGVGYHYVIKLDGTIQYGRPLEKAGAHAKGSNENSIGICLVGGLDRDGNSADTYTLAQWDALGGLVRELRDRFPRASIVGHRDLPGVAKDCPCFDVHTWAKRMGFVQVGG